MQPLPRWIWVLLIAAITMFVIDGMRRPATVVAQPEIAYSRFKALVADGRVESVEMRGEALRGKFLDPQAIAPGGQPVEGFRTRVPEIGDEGLMPLLEAHKVDVEAVSSERSATASMLVWVLPWLIFLAFYIWFWQRMNRNVAGGLGRGGELGKFLEGTGRKLEKAPPDVRFSDVAGQESAKAEVAELVEYLRHPERYTRLGAEVPHGVLLMGPPGTGKTLLARALAGEAGVPFLSISASEFIEVFVGVGASRVRHLFEEAKKHAPSIIFVDELDSIGRVRGAGLGGGHDEREQTLNQILAEMDGFEGHEAVIVLAATNRPDVLDPALLRPGRFDRHVTLDMPDKEARERILEVHARDVPLAEGVDLGEVAAGTPGFSGADLKNLVNEAAMMAAREGVDKIDAHHFHEMRERVMMGSERHLAIEPDERRRLAVHESGHATVAYFAPCADPLFKVSIVPRGRALGATWQLPEHERHTMSEEYLRDRLAVTLAGRVAEKMMLGSVSSGADNDIHEATTLARAMVARWGMSDEIGPMDVRESEEHPFLGREIAQPRHTSDTTAHTVDEAVHHILTDAEAHATEALKKHRKAFERLVDALEEAESLERPEIEAILGPNGLETSERPASDRKAGE